MYQSSTLRIGPAVMFALQIVRKPLCLPVLIFLLYLADSGVSTSKKKKAYKGKGVLYKCTPVSDSVRRAARSASIGSTWWAKPMLSEVQTSLKSLPEKYSHLLDRVSIYFHFYHTLTFTIIHFFHCLHMYISPTYSYHISDWKGRGHIQPSW